MCATYFAIEALTAYLLRVRAPVPLRTQLLQQAVYGIATALPPAAYLRLLLPPPLPEHSSQRTAGVPLPPSLSPATRRRLAEGVVLPPTQHGCGPCPRAVQSVYDAVLAALGPRAPWDGTAQGDGEGEGHETVLAAVGAALGGTELHGVLWRRAFQELCAVLAETDVVAKEGKEGDGAVLSEQQQQQQLGVQSKGLAEGQEAVLGLATHLRRLGGAFRGEGKVLGSGLRQAGTSALSCFCHCWGLA